MASRLGDKRLAAQLHGQSDLPAGAWLVKLVLHLLLLVGGSVGLAMINPWLAAGLTGGAFTTGAWSLRHSL